MKKNKGFTLIELIMVIIVLGVLSTVAIVRLADFGSDARTGVLTGIKSAVDSTNRSLRAASFLNFTTKVCPQFSDGRVVEIYLDGSTPPAGNCNLTATRNDPNVALLIWGWLDNDEIQQTVEITGKDILLFSDPGSPFANTWIGYDMDNDGDVTNDSCFYRYQQPLNDGDVPITEVTSSGC